MKISIDKYAGFCWGVVRAIEFAEQELERTEKVFSLGDVIHNAAEVARLNNLGLETVSVNDFDKLEKGSKILIRAHGEPPSTYFEAMNKGLEIIDATCPVVTKVQERIKKFVDKEYQVVIFGKKDHAEVIGLNGVTNNSAIIIHSLEEALEKIDLRKPTVLFSQTTMDKQEFAKIADALKEKVEELIVSTMEEEAIDFHAKDTICGQVSGREKKLREYAKSNDVIIFIAGRKSSNGKVLYNIAKEENSKTFFVETKDEIEYSWFENAETVGITGATSTPHWQMNEVKNILEEKFN
ncbi:MAG: 4-hydroxy-3-methylbut-2-enyl diphosphate reductase [Chlorobiaceae bacterium]|nr:4-hydroxy-3-methylbut-2-enyl diphosphate reductase [Chlorobiaceae bacterium]MBA4309641.1 4-hydroxy-3-methylbut-2-enyl diphosphate reductase [Chlorobiaceae bacterium]